MPSDERSTDELLELQRRGFELAVKEAEERQAEVRAILYSRRVLQVVEADDGLRDTRLALLEELTRASYPSAVVVAAARHLASEAGLATAKATRRLHPARRLSQRWRIAVTAAWACLLYTSLQGHDLVANSSDTVRKADAALFDLTQRDALRAGA